ncbi:MAG: hypothetical protein IPI51_07745 [Betaproteobacteria bacterium]|nr:hypothetical protein [Betaproteobacteria bacterium]
MATATINYTAAAAVTITLTSLGDAGFRESTAIDNSSSKYMDALVGGKIQIGAPSADGTIAIYAYGSYDGTEYTAGLTGSDGTVTWGTTGSTGLDGANNLPLLGVISVDATDDNDDARWGPFSVAAAFGGVLPTKWGIVVKNSTGAALHATGTNNECQFMGIKYDVA